MKKLMKKKVNVFGKSVSMFAIVLMSFALVSAALIGSWGTITGAVTVDQGLYLDGKNWDAGDIDESYDAFTSLEQKTFISLHNLENTADVDADLKLTRICKDHSNADCDSDISTTYAEWDTPTISLTGGARPNVIYDDGYEMWYEPTAGSIQYAISSDGVNWKDTGSVVTMGDSFFVMKEGTIYYMVNYGASDSVFNIYTSTDGYTWADKGVIYTGSASEFNIPNSNNYAKIDNPKILKDGDEYKMYFQVKTLDSSVPDKYYIYMATSDAIDGTYIIANGGDPILSPSESEAWDDFRVMQPMVLKEGSQYMMMYIGYSIADGGMKVGYAVSNNGITFTKVDISTEGYDTVLGTGVAKPSLVNANGDIVLFHMNGVNIVMSGLVEYVAVNTELTISAHETEGFFIVNKFAQMLVPDIYTITTEVKPVVA